MTKPIEVVLQVIEVLDRLGVPYLIGGSFASAAHGVARATMDADLIAELRPEHAEPLTHALQDTFYVDVAAIQEAILRHSSFNLIHLETMFKVDVFIPRRRAFERSQFARRVRQVVATEPERLAYVASAEDIVLAKLEWYRLGGEVSDRQWQDVVGVLRVQRGGLDLAYLRHWATELGVADLLEKALSEADLEA